MRLNEHQALLTPRIILVPYSSHHVPTYHEWMKDPELQAATASEPLTLEEEYAMQRSWRTDADKLTFIACVNESTSTSTSASTSTSSTSSTINIVRARTADAPPNMIGDVNLFLTPSDAEPADLPNPIIGEIEIMIASAAHRGHGLGRAILLTFLWYVLSSLDAITAEYGSGKEGTSHVEYLRVKISADNARSIRLFESVGFAKISSEPNYFGEVELRWVMSKASRGEVEARMEEVPRVVEYRME